mmetsp:Transcript_31341/g.55085  ORF Transcript_31341/g.55085 Transcript_31341/m.55085 type:complete len:425 (-) Transcript_31341:178-1452(-)
MSSSSGMDISKLSKPNVQVEVSMRQNSAADVSQIKTYILDYLGRNVAMLKNGPLDFSANKALNNHVERIQIYLPESVYAAPFWESEVLVHVYQLSDELGSEEMDGEEEDVTAAETWSLPAKDFDHLWDNLILEKGLKEKLLRFSRTSMIFADKKVNTSIISCNRVVLLYGPPGTGKTTLCKAIAQKLSIRLSDRYSTSMLLEINAHSLFSKWFSESGKLVMKLFEKIHDLVEDKDSLVCVLIDEVESLAANRQSGGGDPSDAVRAVNALLTQLDKLKNYENVIILATSNITEAIDTAFIDRADIKQYIGLPGLEARYEILRTCMCELIRKGIVRESKDTSDLFASYGQVMKASHDDTLVSKLHQVAQKAEGLSGRILRKLPFKCHAFFVPSDTVSAEDFLKHLLHTVSMEFYDRKKLAAVSSNQ